VPPHAVAPGTRLVDRYRLEDPLGEGGGTSVWRAHDEVLDRLVSVRLLSGARSGATLAAARAAAGLSDPRFLRVLDANEVDGLTYVVTEWVAADTLSALVADEPMRPDEAHHLAHEVAEALSAAHVAGLAHLCLVPDAVLRTHHGQVKVSGLAVDAAALGVTVPADPAECARLDARGGAAVLYAALTGKWPTRETGAVEPVQLPEAPRENGKLCTPRQVRPRIPADLDRITQRGLSEPGRADALVTPSGLAAALAATSVTTRIPVIDDPPPAAQFDGPVEEAAPRRRGIAGRLGWAAAILLLVVGLALVGWQVALSLGDQANGSDGGSGSPSTSARSAAILKVAGVTDFDPEGDRTENGDRVARIIDGNPATTWITKTYRQPFGPTGLKDGVGVILDLGAVKDVSEVQVQLEGTGTTVQLRTAQDASDRLADFTQVAQAAGAGTSATLKPDRPVHARYLLLWLTALPQADGGYRGTIAEVVVKG
jgi:hypothetical protein